MLQAAGAIHTDFERGFICAEVMHYEELHELGSENAVKAAGKYRQEVRAQLCHAVHHGFQVTLNLQHLSPTAGSDKHIRTQIKS